MKALAWSLALLLIPITIAASLVLALDRTFLNGPFVKDQLAKTDVYTDVTNYLPSQFLGDQKLSQKDQSAALAKIQQVLTPQYLQEQVNTLIDKAEAVAHGTSSTINLDFSEPIAKLQAAGLPIDANAIKPMTFSIDQQPQVKTAIQSLGLAKLGSYLAFGILLLILLILVGMTRTFSPLITLSVIVALVEFALFIGVKQLPNLIGDKLTADNPIMAHFLPKIQLLLANSSSSLATSFLIFVIIAVLVIIAASVVSILAHKSQPAPEPKSA